MGRYVGLVEEKLCLARSLVAEVLPRRLLVCIIAGRRYDTTLNPGRRFDGLLNYRPN